MRAILNLPPDEREALRERWLKLEKEEGPITVAYGGGVDSTAVILGLHELGIRPQLIMMADTGDEKQETYDFVNGPMTDWLASVGFPPVTWVRYVPGNFKHWPPYRSLSENCLTNSTLPSLAFGFKSCSQKWKVAPQDKFVAKWEPAATAWAVGKRVVKLIGYDAGPKDIRRRNHAGNRDDARYHYIYPLIEWGWDRETCKQYIASRGLPVPPKSACFMCPATRPEELHDFPVELLQRIVIIEARAHDRLQGNWSQEAMDAFNADLLLKKPEAKPRTVQGGVVGLWRTSTKTRSGRITDYIREKALLPAEEIDRLLRETPREALSAEQIESWNSFLGGLMDSPSCAGCSC